MSDLTQLQKLIQQLAEAKRELDRLVFDEDELVELGEPSSPKQISTLEQILGKPLPPSYRSFLELHNGWNSFAGSAKLLAIEDHGSKWVKERLKSLGFLFQDAKKNDPFKDGALPVLLGKDVQSFLVLDPHTVRTDGEMDFVLFDLAREERRFTDFASFLQHDFELTQRLIEREKKGTADEE